MLISEFGAHVIRRPREALGAWLLNHGVRPNHLTVLGFLLTLPVAAALAYSQWRLAFLLMFLPGMCDFLDGEIARQGNLKTRFGGFLDSTLDRYSDLALYFGLLLAFRSDTWGLSVVFAALVGSILTSYTRARAESLFKDFKCGLFERADRYLVLMAGCLFHLVMPALVIIAVLSNLTAIQRIIYTYGRLR